ncbi:MAG: InlB B-repeat-containing protein, partial [Firmicutes bacterium]|nr:InlB B-repeat-containing protein [Bacillota bacterium]
SYILNGGENDPANPATYNVTSPAITLKDPTKPGYEFLGWQPAANIPTGSTGDKEFTATWSTTPIEYNISYILNGGENDPANPATYNVTSPAITLKDPTKPGFTFVEWLPTNSIPSGSTGDKEFTATWKSSFVPVIDIIDVPSTAYANVPLPLNGTVLPSDATNQTIIWNIKDAGITGATLNGNILDIVAPGVLVVTATIVDGLAIGTDFVKDFSITVLLSEKYNYNVYLIPDKTVAKAGEYLYLDIMLVGNLNYFQLTSELTYNNSLLEYIGFEDPQGWMHETRVTAANAVTTRQLPSANTITGTVCNPPVKIVTLVFKVDENFSGNSVITDFVFTNLVVACPQASFVGAPTSWGKTLNIVITE